MTKVFVSGYMVSLFASTLMLMITTTEAAHQNIGASSSDGIFRMFFSLVMLSLTIELSQAVENGGDGIRLPVFGNSIKFVVWWTRFEAFGQLKNLHKVLVREKPADWPDDLTTLSPDYVKRKHQEEMIKHNLRGP